MHARYRTKQQHQSIHRYQINSNMHVTGNKRQSVIISYSYNNQLSLIIV